MIISTQSKMAVSGVLTREIANFITTTDYKCLTMHYNHGASWPSASANSRPPESICGDKKASPSSLKMSLCLSCSVICTKNG